MSLASVEHGEAGSSSREVRAGELRVREAEIWGQTQEMLLLLECQYSYFCTSKASKLSTCMCLAQPQHAGVALS
jgi:hypothetical protein